MAGAVGKKLVSVIINYPIFSETRYIKKITFIHSVTGTPKPSISWSYKAEGNPVFVSLNGSQNVLRISRVEDYHAGIYRCRAHHVLGDQEHLTTLHVLSKNNVYFVSKKEYSLKIRTSYISCTAVRSQTAENNVALPPWE